MPARHHSSLTPRLASGTAVLLAVICALLSGCAEREASLRPLRVVFWAGIEEQKIEQANVDAFMKAHPGVKVSLESIPDNYLEKLAAAFAAHKPPDVLLLDSVLIPRFLDGGVLLDQAPYLGGELEAERGKYFPQVWELAARRGSGGKEAVYALPKDFTPLVVYYNRRLFDKFKVPYPIDGWSWDDYASTAKALTRDLSGDGKPETYGTLVYTWPAFNIVWYWQAGGDVLATDGKRATGYLDSPASIHATEFFTGLVKRGVAPDPTAREALGGQAFMSGQVGMQISGHWAIPGFRSAAEAAASGKSGAKNALSLADIGVVGLPRDKARVNVIYESGWAVARDSKNPELACKLARHLAGAESQKRRAEMGLAISANRTVAEEIARGDAGERAFVAEVKYGRAPWGTRISDWSVVENLLSEAAERVLLGYSSAADACRETAKLIDGELAML